jgi:periplasmic divalent cation tolerance protein
MSENTTILMVYMTAANRTEAEKLAYELVRQRVAACVNILGPIRSFYEWKGVMETSDEVALIAKTTQDRFIDLEMIVKSLHSYECPCMVAWPLTQGHGPFLEWIERQVDKSPS